MKILIVLTILAHKGFTNDSLRDILSVFEGQKVPLAFTLAQFDYLESNAVHTEWHFTGKDVIIKYSK